MKIFLTIILAILGLCGCKKAKMEESCTTNNMRIITKNYNHDSVHIYCPTAFTPNGDGLNDVFRPIGTGFEVVGFDISKGSKFILSDQNLKEWDGTNASGDKLKEGIYHYEFHLTTKHGEQVMIVGEVTLSRSIKYNLCDCFYEDMLHPELGFVNPSQEFCDGH
jgi:gliding motility-associated-like protein